MRMIQQTALKRLTRSAVLALLSIPQLGCFGRPDKVITIKSPSNSVFYTKETSSGVGPVSADYTRVYAHISNNGVTARQLVISGEYIERSSITWTSPNDVEICVDQGITDTFRNEVTLITGDTPSSSITIHNHLNEHC
jgi:hypothetical protein